MGLRRTQFSLASFFGSLLVFLLGQLMGQSLGLASAPFCIDVFSTQELRIALPITVQSPGRLIIESIATSGVFPMLHQGRSALAQLTDGLPPQDSEKRDTSYHRVGLWRDETGHNTAWSPGSDAIRIAMGTISAQTLRIHLEEQFNQLKRRDDSLNLNSEAVRFFLKESVMRTFNLMLPLDSSIATALGGIESLLIELDTAKTRSIKASGLAWSVQRETQAVLAATSAIIDLSLLAHARALIFSRGKPPAALDSRVGQFLQSLKLLPATPGAFPSDLRTIIAFTELDTVYGGRASREDLLTLSRQIGLAGNSASLFIQFMPGPADPAAFFKSLEIKRAKLPPSDMPPPEIANLVGLEEARTGAPFLGL